VGDPVPHPSRHLRRGPSLEPTNSLQPGLQARRQAPELTISFTSPNAHPKTDTPGDPSQATVATTHTVTGTPSKRYNPDQLAEIVAELTALRRAAGTADTQPYDTVVAVEPGCDPAPYAAAGATWWLVGVAADAARADLVRATIRDGPAGSA
jgi:hypothetical protein